MVAKLSTSLLRSSGLFPGTRVEKILVGPLVVLSSSSLSEPPEELLSEAARGTLLVASVGVSVDENQTRPEQCGPTSFSGF